MPSAPVTARTLYWERLSDGTIHLLDWALVSTSIGLMVEPRTILRMGENVRDEDIAENGYTQLSVVPPLPTGNYALDQLAFSGIQWPRFRSTDPGVK